MRGVVSQTRVCERKYGAVLSYILTDKGKFTCINGCVGRIATIGASDHEFIEAIVLVDESDLWKLEAGCHPNGESLPVETDGACFDLIRDCLRIQVLRGSSTGYVESLLSKALENHCDGNDADEETKNRVFEGTFVDGMETVETGDEQLTVVSSQPIPAGKELKELLKQLTPELLSFITTKSGEEAVSSFVNEETDDQDTSTEEQSLCSFPESYPGLSEPITKSGEEGEEEGQLFDIEGNVQQELRPSRRKDIRRYLIYSAVIGFCTLFGYFAFTSQDSQDARNRNRAKANDAFSTAIHAMNRTVATNMENSTIAHAAVNSTITPDMQHGTQPSTVLARRPLTSDEEFKQIVNSGESSISSILFNLTRPIWKCPKVWSNTTVDGCGDGPGRVTCEDKVDGLDPCYHFGPPFKYTRDQVVALFHKLPRAIGDGGQCKQHCLNTEEFQSEFLPDPHRTDSWPKETLTELLKEHYAPEERHFGRYVRNETCTGNCFHFYCDTLSELVAACKCIISKVACYLALPGNIHRMGSNMRYNASLDETLKGVAKLGEVRQCYYECNNFW